MVETYIPADGDVGLGLGLFETFVVIGFYLDEGTEDVLVVICVIVPGKEDNGEVNGGDRRRLENSVPKDLLERNLFGFVIDTRLVQILQGSICVLPPEFFETIYLRVSDLTRAELLGFGGRLHKPRKELTIFNEGHPER